MNGFIEGLKNADVMVKGLAVMAGGMGGVFLTLFVFYLIIQLMERIRNKKAK